MFRRLRYSNSALMRTNLLLLMAVSFLPYPTRLVAEAIGSSSEERIAVVFYGLSLLVISVLFAVLWAIVMRNRELLKEEVDDADARRIMLAATPSLGFYAIVLALSVFLPKIAAFGYLAIAILAVVRSREAPEQPAA